MLKIDFNPPDKQLSQFGWFSLFGFPLVGLAITFGALGRDQIGTLFWVLLAVGVVVFGLSRINPQWVRPVFVGLMLIAIPIGIVISFVLMALIYYVMFTIVGLIFRLIGKDPLDKRPDPSLESYWHVRPEPRSPASYLKLY